MKALENSSGPKKDIKSQHPCSHPHLQLNSDFFPQYQSALPQLSPEFLKQKQSDLLKHGFLKRQKFSEFTSKVIKVCGISLLYQIVYGFYQIQISVYLSRLNTARIERKKIGSGKFGEIVCFELDGVMNAAKVFKQSEYNLFIDDEILKEVFITKMADILGVGPHFYNSYNYDIIGVKNKCQFVMEYCPFLENDLSGKNVEKIRKDLLENLAILHAFRIVHSDVKMGNLGWSQVRSKYILIDFGLSTIIEEKPGKKSLASFRGSYSYCSPQMQKTFFVKQSYVDMYYNDLYGLNILTSLHQKQNYSQVQFSQPSSQNHSCSPYSWNTLVSYFKIKYYFFTQKQQNILNLIQNQSRLCFSFRKLIRLENYNSLDRKLIEKKAEERVVEVYGSMEYEQILGKQSMDSFLYSEQTVAEISLNMTEPNQNNFYIILLRNKMDVIWKQPHWTQILFFFLYESIYHIKQYKFKQEIINRIAQLQSFSSDLTNKYHKEILLLREFEKYFVSIHQISKLFLLMTYYELIFLFDDAERLKSVMLTITLEKEEPQLYTVYFFNTIIYALCSDAYPFVEPQQKIIGKSSNPISVAFVKLLNEFKGVEWYRTHHRQFDIQPLLVNFRIFIQAIPGQLKQQRIQEQIFRVFQGYISVLREQNSYICSHISLQTPENQLNFCSKNYKRELQEILRKHQRFSCVTDCKILKKRLCFKTKASIELTKIFILNHTFLSRIQTLWEIQYHLSYDTKKAEQIILQYLNRSSSSYRHFYNFFGFLVCVWDKDNQNFSSEIRINFYSFINKLSLDEFRHESPLLFQNVCEFLFRYFQLIDFFSVKKLGSEFITQSRPILLKLRTILLELSSVNMEIALVLQLLQIILLNFNQMPELSFVINFERFLKIIDIFKSKQELTSGLRFCYQFIEYVKTKIQCSLLEKIEDAITLRFSPLAHLQDFTLIVSVPFVPQSIGNCFIRNSHFDQLLNYLMKFSLFSGKNSMINSFWYFIKLDSLQGLLLEIPKQSIIKFTKNYIFRLCQQKIIHNPLLPVFIINFRKIIGQELSTQELEKFTKMLCLILQYSKIRMAPLKNQIKTEVFMWYRQNYEQSLKPRKKLKNLVGEARCSNDYSLFSEVVNLRYNIIKQKIRKSHSERNLKQTFFNCFKKKLKKYKRNTKEKQNEI